ncbi:hypothetical protein ASF91_17095 [Rhizobium sp. Leaf155]|nr:hypothetical protein ASF91_17095 [Rhizobium sp. Leaf155]
MAILSPAQRRKAACGPAFRQSYIDDGWKAGAPYIIGGFARFHQVAEIRERLRAKQIRGLDAVRISYLMLLHARRDIRNGRRLTPLPG